MSALLWSLGGAALPARFDRGTARCHWLVISQLNTMRLRFTIRDLLWLTVVVALAVGWYLNSRSPWKVTRTSRGTLFTNSTNGDTVQLNDKDGARPTDVMYLYGK
jgi:hypothetical protein